LAAYVYALLSTPAYQARFEEELEGKVVRVPLTAEPTLWEAAVALGSELIRLHTFGERFPDARTRSPRTQPSWDSGVTTLPDDHAEITYDEDRQQLRIGDGAVSHVPVEVWDYTVSGYPVVRRWLEHRTKRGRGRPTSELDDIRPTAWNDSWNDELLDLLRALTASCELRPEQDELLARICDGPLIAGSSLPEPSEKERTVPPTERPKVQSDQLSADL
jgi:predicted helicase